MIVSLCLVLHEKKLICIFMIKSNYLLVHVDVQYAYFPINFMTNYLKFDLYRRVFLLFILFLIIIMFLLWMLETNHFQIQKFNRISPLIVGGTVGMEPRPILLLPVLRAPPSSEKKLKENIKNTKNVIFTGVGL